MAPGRFGSGTLVAGGCEEFQGNHKLVVWNMAFMTFHILGIVIPTDELIFFRGVRQPPTSSGFPVCFMLTKLVS
jgi:hypothetical protein